MSQSNNILFFKGKRYNFSRTEENLMSPFNEYILKIYINLLHFIVKFNVNSTCYMFHGQPIEPDSLKRYKKAKKD